MLVTFATTLLTLAPGPSPQVGTLPDAFFNGRIVPDAQPSICQQGTHLLDCNGARLESTTLDLAQYEGGLWRFAAVKGGVECDVYDVVAVSPATATLDVCGTPQLGCPVRLRVGPTGVIGQWWLWASGGAAFAPLDPITGTILIQPPGILLGSGFTTGGSGAYFEADVPDELALVGATFYFQGVRRDVGPIGPLELTNAECFTVLPPLGPPCVQPGC